MELGSLIAKQLPAAGPEREPVSPIRGREWDDPALLLEPRERAVERSGSHPHIRLDLHVAHHRLAMLGSVGKAGAEHARAVVTAELGMPMGRLGGSLTYQLAAWRPEARATVVFRGWGWSSDEVALSQVTAHSRKSVERGAVLDPFGDHPESQGVTQFDRRPNQRLVRTSVRRQTDDEGCVQFEFAHR